MQAVQWLTAKDVVKVNALKWPDKEGIKDLCKAYSLRQSTYARTGGFAGVPGIYKDSL
jgi:hypothetical protein